jgi:nitrogen regulatory protein PII
MRRIRIVLKESDVTAVRKAVCCAGGDRVVVTPRPHRVCAAELADWYCGTPFAQRDDQVSLEVLAEDDRADAVVSAIVATAHVGKIEQITRMSAEESRVAAGIARKAA